MISRLLCPTGKSHSLPLWHLIHDHCLFANAFASLGCSRISFTFYLSSCFIGLFLCVWWCLFHLLQLHKAPGPSLWTKDIPWASTLVHGFKIPFLSWCLWNKYFQCRLPLLKSFHLGVWEIWNSMCLKSTIFPPKLLHTATPVSVGDTSNFMVQLSQDYWKNHSFDSMDLWQQRDVSAF